MSDRDKITHLCSDLYARGFVSSTGGNVSTRGGSTFLVTPTARSLARLSPDEIVEVDSTGEVLGHGRPSKEIPFHLAAYEARPDVRCIIHGHSPYAVAASTLLEPDPINALPVYTAGYVARVGRLPLLPYYPSGSPELAQAVSAAARGDAKAMLLQNHGFIAIGPDMETAFNTADELLDALQVYVLTQGRARPLYEAQEWPVGRSIDPKVVA